MPAKFLADERAARIAADLFAAFNAGIGQISGVAVNNEFAAAPPNRIGVVHHRVTRRRIKRRVHRRVHHRRIRLLIFPLPLLKADLIL